MSVFTFDDGSEIVTPFQLNDQQKTALRGLEAFIANPEYTNNEVTLTGYAGTGKTTIIGLFDEYLFKKYSGTVFYSAVTYRANAVTKMNNPGAKTYTLNQLFGISAETDLTDSTLDLRKIVNEQRFVPKVSGGELIIIDEASMVSPAFYQFINNAKDVFEIKVIYVGDPAQLSYIAKDGEKSALSPVFSGNKGKVLSLTKVERTGDSPVLAEATSLRNGAWLSYETKLTEDGNGVEYTNDDAVANAAIEDAFTSEEFKDNKLFFRVLSATNDIIPSINAKVREIRFGKNPEQVVAGDILMGYDNLYNEAGTGGEPVIINSGDYEVLSVTPDTTTIKLTTRGDLNATRLVPVKTFRVTLGNVMDDSRGPVTVTIVDNNTPRSVFLDVANELQALNAARSQAFRKRDYGLARSIGNRLVDIKTSFVSMKNIEVGGKLKIKKMLDYGYAHTIHKSQGGTYDNVLIYADSIDKFKNEDTQQQLAYVAVSRAKDKVTVLTKYKLAESAQDNGKWRTEFPRILMEVRDELRNETAKPEDTASKQWSSKEGWSEAYYKSKVLPKLDNAWQVEFELAPDQNVKHDFKGTMLFDYGNNKNSNVTASSTIEAIGNGERTATTRYESDGHMDYWKRVNIGDVIEYTRPGYFPVKVVVTKPFTKLQGTKPEDAFTQLKKEENSTNYTVPTLKIISGGQTGVDTIGVQVAKELGIETGGTAPKGFLRERGMDNEDISSYNLVEITDEEQADYTRRKGKRDPYTGRTELNVRNSDGTVYFYTSDDKTGLLATKRSADDWNKPFITNPTAEELNKWLNNNNIKTLNVAGNRGSKLAGEQASNIGNIIKNAFSTPVQQEVSNTSNPFDDAPSFSDEVVVDGDSIQTLVTVNDNGLKETTISTRRAELEEIIKQRTEAFIDVNAFRSEFDATVEAFKDADSDSLNNALIKLLCKYQ